MLLKIVKNSHTHPENKKFDKQAFRIFGNIASIESETWDLTKGSKLCVEWMFTYQNFYKEVEQDCKVRILKLFKSNGVERGEDVYCDIAIDASYTAYICNDDGKTLEVIHGYSY